ncbi:YihY/virulence factor BrkB family protein [Marinobacter fonticola]|uniref:YihY/virulence factor BrkB family protein n=1 Tax=Marinobacter fonticola TaxID=2603215 RepID=UPI0011E7B675|nr:YihY/virulence factor BrkB family protein [Marinobacter fonticola]
MTSIQFKERLNALEQWILANPNPPRHWPWIGLYKACRIIYAVARDVINGLLTLHAMSLVYTTLLSIVPLLALSFSVLKAMDVHQRIQPFLYQFFEPMGPQGIDMANKVLEFVDNIKVGVLGSVGLALLIYTVISLVQKIEFSFNTIWRVPQMRSLAQRFSNYLSVIMIGPLLMVLAIGISATIFSSTVVQTLIAIEPLGTVVLFLSRFTPFFLVVLAFTFMYVFMPNTKVKPKYALIGGLIAGVTWQGCGMLFASFVAGSARYEAIYSSFAIGIILLIWLYLNWLILLLGSSIVFYIQNPSAIAKRHRVRVSPALQEQVALVLMWLVCKPFSEGKAAPQQERLEQNMGVPAEVSRKISDKLIRGGLLMLAGPAGDGLVPARSLDLISVEDILSVIRADEERLIRRLPKVLPEDLSPLPNCSDPRTMAELLKPHRD